MFSRDKPSDLPCGILNDWDLTGKASVSHNTAASRRRTGTPPFMAIDLLTDDPPPHLYRHDLESFLYILVWAVVHYESNGQERPRNSILENWTTGDLVDIQSQKMAYLSLAHAFSAIMGAITPAFKPKLSQWISPLHLMFHQYKKTQEAKNVAVLLGRVPEGWDEETAGGTISYEHFMKALGESPDLDC
ncbi:hypothetical protein EVG20_g8966 [Dentipellis fragilis]|uniref:Fungal-type protein kinase domain-containing protein n=1 Tax=Dentipellis fragilis TaxID=205917 RepID=A0A4Y9Y335_9AGAM|nr:hypothetical protein EVG20_g8966 [Dentipellis fragilis]